MKKCIILLENSGCISYNTISMVMYLNFIARHLFNITRVR